MRIQRVNFWLLASLVVVLSLGGCEAEADADPWMDWIETPEVHLSGLNVSVGKSEIVLSTEVLLLFDGNAKRALGDRSTPGPGPRSDAFPAEATFSNGAKLPLYLIVDEANEAVFLAERSTVGGQLAVPMSDDKPKLSAFVRMVRQAEK